MQFHRVDPQQDLAQLRAFLTDSDPRDYLLDEMEEWTRDGRLWAGTEGGVWVAFGRVHDLGSGEAWVSGLRVALPHRGQGMGNQLLNGLLADARSVGLSEYRAVIEDENLRSRALFARNGFRPVVEMTLRRGSSRPGGSDLLRRARSGDRLGGPVGWIPAATGRVDLVPGPDAGRFGRWDPRVVARWVDESKLYLAPGMAVAVQADWLTRPRTLWANPLTGDPEELLPAIGSLANRLGQEEWQAFLPSTEPLRRLYADQGLHPHPAWGDRIHLYERID